MTAQERIDEFRRATARLDEALAAGAANPLFVDAAIQRFEFCVELAWKSLRVVLARDHGVEVASPKPAFQEAYKVHLIDDEAVWIDMLRDRNLSSHTYRETLAQAMYARLPRYAGLLRKLAATL